MQMRKISVTLFSLLILLILAVSLLGGCTTTTTPTTSGESVTVTSKVDGTPYSPATTVETTSTGGSSQPASTSTSSVSSMVGTLPIFHAGSLTIPFAQVTETFNEYYPGIEVLTEGAGSQTTIRKVTELGKTCGVIGSADYTVIPQLMFPDYADWYIVFASNQMCLTYTDTSQYADEINSDNWYEIIQRDGVTFGHSDPNQDPCGYRSLMVLQLAEEFYGVSGLNEALINSSGKLMRPKSVELIALLQSGDLDYAFEYTSVAAQHNLNYVEFPSQINLADEQYTEFYAQAEVQITGAAPGEYITQTGKPIVYGLTIPSNFGNPELAVVWIDFLLSDEGKAIMVANGQPPVPYYTNDISKVPDELKKYVQ